MKLLYCLLVLFTFNILVNCTEEYFFTRPDLRKCAAPKCGGNFLTKVNDFDGKEYHQNEMSLINANLNVSLIKEYHEVIVMGELSEAPNDDDDSEIYYSLFIQDIYHTMALPAQPASPSKDKARETYYILKSSGCNSDLSSCESIEATAVNQNTVMIVQKYVHPYSNIALLDQNWLNSRILGVSGPSAIVKGYVLGNKLIISKIYVSTLDPGSTCPENTHTCPQNKVATFVRKNYSRCPIFDSCVSRGPCPLSVPHCPDGYKQYSYASTPKGCPKYFCDPSALPNPSNVGDP